MNKKKNEKKIDIQHGEHVIHIQESVTSHNKVPKNFHYILFITQFDYCRILLGNSIRKIFIAVDTMTQVNFYQHYKIPRNIGKRSIQFHEAI